MSSSTVTGRAGASAADWARLRPEITHIWLNRARSIRELVKILRDELDLVATEKTCGTHVRKWGLTTYKKRGQGDQQQEQAASEPQAMPSRKRKGRQLERAPKRAPGPRILRQITSNPDIDPLLIPLVHRPAELMLHSIVSLCTMLRGHGVFRTWRDFVTPHPSVKGDDSINWWHRPVDLVCSADDHLKWTPLGKKNRHYMAAQELRYLVRYMHTGTSLRPAHPDWAEAKPEQRPARYQAMIIRFWRNLHRLLRRDLVWSGHGHVYVTKYILDFGFAVADTCGAEHPLQRLLFALSQASNADLQEMLRSGASWMLGQLAPAFGEKLEGKRNFIIHVWTDGLYW